MVRAWAVAAAAVVVVSPFGAEAARGDIGERYWTEAKARKVRAERSALSQVAQKSMSAVVSITTVQEDSGPGEEQTGLGSGFIIHPDGYILTSAHVIEGAREITVTVLTADGHREDLIADVVGRDKPTDFALLKVDAGRKLPVLPLGKSNTLNIADWVVVIGNPFGLGHSVSVGVVSYMGRTDVTPAGLEGYFDYIQTDAAINPGNSGGPVLDLNGNVVAIANAVNVSGQGIAFAIPIDVAKSIIPHLIRDGEVRRGWVGISIQDLTPDMAAEFGSRALHGVVVSKVAPDSPAAKAGLQIGDVIVGVDDVETQRAHALRWRVSNKGVGKKVTLKVDRSGEPVSVTLTLTEKPSTEEASLPDLSSPAPALKKDAAATTPPDDKPWLEPTRLDIGAAVTDVDPDAAKSAGLADEIGALVAAVEEGSIGSRAGLSAGDVVLKVNRTEVTSRADLVAALNALPDGEWVRMFVRRNAETHALTFRKP